jgi:hypothetical protein
MPQSTPKHCSVGGHPFGVAEDHNDEDSQEFTPWGHLAVAFRGGRGSQPKVLNQGAAHMPWRRSPFGASEGRNGILLAVMFWREL